MRRREFIMTRDRDAVVLALVADHVVRDASNRNCPSKNRQ